MHLRFLLLAPLLACTALAAQTPAAPAQEPPQLEGRKNQKVEHIRVEDEAVVIDEVRYAGQTQSITVKPKGEMPEYSVEPANLTRTRPREDRSGSSETGGTRSWTVLKF
jgi:hypothetical protein